MHKKRSRPGAGTSGSGTRKNYNYIVHKKNEKVNKEENKMGKYFYLLSAEGADGNAVFRAESASCASVGDLLKHNGEIFEITGTCYCSEDSDEYQMIAQLSKIREVDAIYTERWTHKEKEAEDV